MHLFIYREKEQVHTYQKAGRRPEGENLPADSPLSGKPEERAASGARSHHEGDRDLIDQESMLN